jgi:hypothetical protein
LPATAAPGESRTTEPATRIAYSLVQAGAVAYTVTIFIYKVVAGGLTVLANEATTTAISPAVATEIAHAVTVFVREVVAGAVAVFVHEARTSDERCV